MLVPTRMKVLKMNSITDFDGHPEEYWDRIREYSSDNRYRPSNLESLLLDQAGFRCSICQAPYFELHHIKEMRHGGKTEYDNLIVLCPNCHTRVHREGIPDPEQLLQIKRKQEIAYELPIRSRIGNKEKQYLRTVSVLPEAERLLYMHSEYAVIQADSHEDAFARHAKNIDLLYLHETGIILAEVPVNVQAAEPTNEYHVTITYRLTHKGLKWVRSMNEIMWGGLLDGE